MTNEERNEAIIDAVLDGCNTTDQVADRLQMDIRVACRMMLALFDTGRLKRKEPEGRDRRITYTAPKARTRKPKPAPQHLDAHAALFG